MSMLLKSILFVSVRINDIKFPLENESSADKEKTITS